MGIAIVGRGRAAWIIASLLAAITLSACDEEEEAPLNEAIRPVRAVQLADSSPFAQRWFSGRARPTQEIDLSFRVAGPLFELPADVGDTVHKGDLIARIDPTTFAADVNKARAELEQAIAATVNADAQHKRQQTLTSQGWTAQARLDEYIAAANTAKATVAAQRAALERAELDLGYAELTAPFGGEVVRTYVENFQHVREQQAIVRLIDSSRIEMVVDVPETLITYAYYVANVEVIFDPFPELVIPAKIKEIGSEASETTRTYPVTLIMDQPKGAVILPGMAGKASAKGPVPPEVAGAGLVVPDTAVFTLPDDPGTYVWVLDPAAGVVNRREIRTGNLTHLGLSVLDGVKPGEWVVTAGAHYLEEGQQVRLLEEIEGEEDPRT
jgi:RND family efflux transporter MFP subunit